VRIASLLVAHSLKRVRTLLLITALLLGAFQLVLILVAGSIQNSGGFEQLAALLPAFFRELLGPALVSFMSFSGIVSFKTADDVRAAAALCPDDRLLVETDAPYLAPVPHRGRRNEPALLPAVGAALAAATDRDVEAVAATTDGNARIAFRLPGP